MYEYVFLFQHFAIFLITVYFPAVIALCLFLTYSLTDKENIFIY